MSKALLLCRVLGDGQSPATAYRPAINDVVDPSDPLGPQPFVTSAVIGVDPGTGQLLHDWCIAMADGVKHSLYRDNPDIDPLPPIVLLGLPLSGVAAVAERVALFSKMTARGIDVSAFDLSSSYRSLVQHLLELHQPGFAVEDLDVGA